MTEREQGLDLLRAFGFLMVVTFHSFLFNGYFFEAQKGFAMLMANSMRNFSMCCNGIFMMLTGYLKTKKYMGMESRGPAAEERWSIQTEIIHAIKGLIPILRAYFLAAAISIPVRHFLLGDVQPLDVWVSRFFQFSGVYYGWYVEMYIGLSLMSPFLQILLKQIEEQRCWKIAVCILVFLTAMPGTLPVKLFPDYWKNLYPVTYYVLGAWIVYRKPEVNSRTCFCTAGIVTILSGVFTLISTDQNASSAWTPEFGGLWIVVITVSVFLGGYRMTFSAPIYRGISFLASGSFGGYLISHLLDAWLYMRFPQWRTPEKYVLLFLVVTVGIFLLASIMGRWLMKISGYGAILHPKTINPSESIHNF